MGISFDNIRGVRDYISKMVTLRSKLISLEILHLYKFTIINALNSLPVFFFSQIKIYFIPRNEERSINDLFSEEEKL